MDDLIAAWQALKEASADMLEGPKPTWPWDRTSTAFLENQRLRDRVQGVGMRFSGIWRGHADEIRRLVDANPEAFPRFHETDRKGGRIDPTDYMQSMVVMPILIELETKS